MLNVTVSANHAITLPASPKFLEGIYFVSASSNSNDTLYFDSVFNVTSCSSGQVVDAAGNCVDAPRIGALRPVLTAGTASVSYASLNFIFAADPAISGFNVEGVNITTFSVKASYGIGNIAANLAINSTFNGANYTTAASTYFFPLPSNIPGNWYLELTILPSTSGTANITITTPQACTAANPKGCTNTITSLVDATKSNLLSFQIGNGKLGYAAYAGADAGWRVGVSTAQGPPFNAQLRTYIAYGYVPFIGASGAVIADYTLGCTLPANQCSQVATIELPKPSQASVPYYVAIDYRNGTAVTTGLVWASTSKYPCPTCNHGSCPAFTTADYASYGRCKCIYGYAGTDCSIAAANFRIQIIVVIVIGVLLLVTAIIGLVAWFISKRRAAQTTGYEKV